MKWLVVAIIAYFLVGWVKSTTARGKARGTKRSTRSTPPAPSPRPSNRPPHEVLGIERGASDEEIRKAYKQLARRYHPDAVVNETAEVQAVATRRFREVNEAFHTLTTKEQRER